jgi:hypothetical protein
VCWRLLVRRMRGWVGWSDRGGAGDNFDSRLHKAARRRTISVFDGARNGPAVLARLVLWTGERLVTKSLGIFLVFLGLWVGAGNGNSTYTTRWWLNNPGNWSVLIASSSYGAFTAEEVSTAKQVNAANEKLALLYDGLGRLIRKETPTSPTDARIRYEDYFYDGVRRVQEIVHQPTGSPGGGGGGGGGSQYSSAAGGGGLTEEPVGRPGRGEAGALSLLEDSPAGGGTTVQWSEGGGFDDGVDLATPEDELFEPEAVVYETGPVRWAYPQAGGDAGGSTTTMSAGGDAPRRLAIGGVYLEDAESPAGDAQATLYYDPNVTYAIWKEREYIWHDGDVDELIVQIDKTGTPYYSVQDANLNVTAYVNFNTVVQRQIQYDPYGRVIETDAFGQTHLHPVLRVGFQGLFADRLETDPTRQPLEPEAPVLIHARNRTYHPKLGRWLQRDPNATGQPLLEALAVNGQGFGSLMAMFSLDTHFADGANAYQFALSNPVNQSDPLGLRSDWFEEADDIVAGIAAERYSAATAISTLVSTGLNNAALLGGLAFSLLPGADALRLAAMLAQGADVTYMDIVSAGLSIGGGAILGKLIGKSIATLARYGERGVDALATIPLPILQAICFSSGTLVLMGDDTFRAIEEIRIGDCVKCDYDPIDNNGAETCEVVGTSSQTSNRLIELTFLKDGRQFVVNCTPEHPFYVESLGYVEAQDLRLLSSTIGSARLVRYSEFEGYSADVFNINVLGAHNYYVSEGRFLVHNACRFWKGNKLTKWVADQLGIDRRKLGDAIEKIKKSAGRGGADNITIDLNNGNVLDEIGEVLGNVFD